MGRGSWSGSPARVWELAEHEGCWLGVALSITEPENTSLPSGDPPFTWGACLIRVQNFTASTSTVLSVRLKAS